MTTLFAQVPTPTGPELLNVLLGGVSLLAIAYLVLNVIDKWRTMFKPPLALQANCPGDHNCPALITLRGRVDAVSSDLARIERSTTESLAEIAARREHDMDKLYAEIRSLNGRLEKICGILEASQSDNR